MDQQYFIIQILHTALNSYNDSNSNNVMDSCQQRLHGIGADKMCLVADRQTHSTNQQNDSLSQELFKLFLAAAGCAINRGTLGQSH